MWCPSASLSIWANAWLAGQAAPDDVLDALSCWAPVQSVTAHDPVAAGHTGLPWPDANHSGAMSVLQTLRTAAGRMAISTPSEVNHPCGPIGIVLPVPGDVRGLAAGTQFERDALAAGEAVILTNPNDPGSAVGLVPDLRWEEADIDPPKSGALDICALNWTVYALPDAPVLDHQDLGEAEYALRSAVRSAVDSLAALGLGSSGADGRDPRALVEQALEPGRQHQVPQHAPSRALRVLENAAHIDAIITVSSELMPIGIQSSSEAQIATNALRPLETVVRSARIAAVSAILRSAWQV